MVLKSQLPNAFNHFILIALAAAHEHERRKLFAEWHNSLKQIIETFVTIQ